MISILDLFGNFFDCDDATDEVKANAQDFLDNVLNPLLIEAEAHGIDLKINPRTKTYVSGEQYGGFRPQSCPIGAPHSAHKLGLACDVYDPDGALDAYLTDAILAAHGAYREAPSATPGWAHITSRAPASGHRTFMP